MSRDALGLKHTANLRQYLVPGLLDILGICTLAVVIFGRTSFCDDPGVGWHLRTGQWISQHLAVPHSDPFLFTTVGKPWVSTQWLSDLLLWSLFSLGSWPLLFVFIVGVLVATFVSLLGAILQREGVSEIAAFFVIALVCLISSIQWVLRPVVFSFLFVLYVYDVVLRLISNCSNVPVRRDLFSLLLLPLAFSFWANLHPGFPMGLVVLIAGILSLAIKVVRTPERALTINLIMLAASTLFCLLATLVNPYGVRLHQNIFSLLGDNYFMNLNIEWFSPDFSQLYAWPFGVALVLLVVAAIRRCLSPFDWFVLVPFTYMALDAQRYIPFVAIVAALPLARLIGQLRFPSLLPFTRKTSALYTSLVWLVILVIVWYRGGIPGRDVREIMPGQTYPYRALELIAAEAPNGRILQHPDWGGFITLRLYPHRAAFIDDRNELNGRQIYEEYFSLVNLRPGWETILDKYDFDWALLKIDDRLGEKLTHRDAWREIFRDNQSVLFKHER